MKKLLSLLLLLPITLLAQKVTVKRNPITDKPHVETSWIPFIKKGIKTRGFETDARVIREDDQYILQLRITDQVRTHLIDPGKSLGFFYDDNRVTYLICSNGNKSREELDFIDYPMTDEQMDLILHKPVNKVKLEWERGFTQDWLSEDYLTQLRNCISIVKDKKRVDERTMDMTGWTRVYRATNPKTVIVQRIIGTDSGAFLQMRMFGHELKQGHRLNIYNKDEKISLFARSVTYEDSRVSGRHYSLALFPVKKEDLIFMSKATYDKITLQTSTDKLIITDNESVAKLLRNDALNASEIYFH